MANDLALEVFKAARSQVETTARWHVIVLVALAYFHLAIVVPYGASSAKKLAIERDIAEQRATQAALAPASELARDLATAVSEHARDVSNALLQDLVDRFARLNDIVLALGSMEPSDAEGKPGAALFQQPQSAFNVQQMQIPNLPAMQTSDPVAGAGDALEPMDPALRRSLASGPAGDGGLESGLQAYVDQALVGPAFDRADTEWRERHLPALEARGRDALDAVQAAAHQTEAARDELGRISGSIDALLGQARALRFEPPADPGWWRTVAGKESSIDSMMQDLGGGVETAAAAQVDLQAFLDGVETTVHEQEMLSDSVAAALADLEQQAKELQAQLGEIGGPLKIVSFRLAVLAPLLPVIIAGASGVASLLTAEALRRMCVAVTLTGDPGERDRLRPWLAEAAGRGRRRVTVRAVAISAVLGAWLLATLLVTRPLAAFFVPNAVLLAVALVFLAGCRFWLWRRSLRALSLAATRG